MGHIRVKQTPNQRAWRQQARRINMTINEMKTHGFVFHEEAYVKYNPKRVTKKTLQKIQSVTNEQIVNQGMLMNPETGKYEYAHLNMETGEVTFKGSTLKGGLSTWGLLNDKKKYQDNTKGTADYATAYETIINNFVKYFQDAMETWGRGESRADVFVNMINDAKNNYSLYDVAKALNDAEVMVGIPTYPDLMYEEGVAHCNEFMRYFFDLLNVSDAQVEKWETAMESMEYWRDTDNGE